MITATKATRKYYICHRVTPQASYYIACGQMSKAAVRRKEGTLYGSNYLTGYDSKEEYESEIARLTKEGNHVQ